MYIHQGAKQARGSLMGRLTSLLQKVDNSLVTQQQKLKLFKSAICPRLTWDLSVNSFPLSWIERQLQPLATRFLKRWCGLALPADPKCLFLSKENGGQDLPSITTLYKQLQVSKAAIYTCSKDPPSHLTRQESRQQRATFKPYQEVIHVMTDDPRVSSRNLHISCK